MADSTHGDVSGNHLNRRILLISGASLLPGVRFLNSVAWAAEAKTGYLVKEVSFVDVDVTDEFWAPRMEVNRKVSIWHCYEHMKRAEAFGTSKLVEGAAYMLAKQPDPKLEQYTDEIIDKMVEAIKPRLADPDKAVRLPGHFLEASVAYYRATGKRKMLDAALEDCKVIEASFGPGKKIYISQHEGQKIGLLQLYRETGDPSLLELAKFFLDSRGKPGYERTGEYALDRTYAQDQEPVIEQKEAIGHCVRATFLYIPLTDIAAMTGRREYADASEKIWQDAVYKKTYLTGSIGSIRFHEQYGAAYDLPNLSAWNETCASYGNIVWNHRMFLLHRDAKYIDVMERILYNGFASGVSLKGDSFFYQNPLKSFGNYERFDWIDVPCCPPNVVRLTASLGSYIYAQTDNEIYINLFVGSRAKVKLGDSSVVLKQETRYPWDGSVKVTVDPERAGRFAVLVRIPGWARNEVMPGDLYRFQDKPTDSATLSINGKPLTLRVEQGYARIERDWHKNDVIELMLPMSVRQVEAREEAKENRGLIALQRGPLVYCAEWPDNKDHALNIFIPNATSFKSRWEPNLLGGVEVVEAQVKAIDRAKDSVELKTEAHELVAIPYYAWSNRGQGEMAVWMPRNAAGAWYDPIPPASISSVRTSGGVEKKWTGYNDQNDDIRALYDGKDPSSSADESNLYFRMRPETGSPAWIEYEFKQPKQVSSTQVYWYDDRRFCHAPSSWKVLYREGEQWKPVENLEPYSVTKDQFNGVSFKPVKTTALRLEIEPAVKHYKVGEIGPPAAMFLSKDTEWREMGLLEWRVI